MHEKRHFDILSKDESLDLYPQEKYQLKGIMH